jgi:hypothetical protein
MLCVQCVHRVASADALDGWPLADLDVLRPPRSSRARRAVAARSLLKGGESDDNLSSFQARRSCVRCRHMTAE